MSTDFLSTEMSPVKEANKTPAVMKKDLPDELYPGMPIEETPAAEAAADEPAAGIGSEAPPTEEKQKAKAEEFAKAKTGAIIYTIAFIVNIYLFFRYMTEIMSFFIDPIYAVVGDSLLPYLLLAFFLFFPTIASVPAAVFTRIIVNQPIRNGFWFYSSVVLSFHFLLMRILGLWGKPLAAFTFELFFCAIVTCEIIGYKKGEPFYFVRMIVKGIRMKLKIYDNIKL